MFYRCPKDHHFTSLEMCRGRKERKHPGCVTCKDAMNRKNPLLPGLTLSKTRRAHA